MSGRQLAGALVGLTLVLGVVQAARAQKPAYGVEEYNAYVETTRSQDANERLQSIDTFLKNYPESVLRAEVYPNQFRTAWAVQRYPLVMQAVDSFLSLDRERVVSLFQEWNFDQARIEGYFYEAHLLYTYSFLQTLASGKQVENGTARKAGQHAQAGLEAMKTFYGLIPEPTDAAQRKQLEDQKRQQEGAFYSVLAEVAWRNKDYAAATREYTALVNMTPEQAPVNYRLGLSFLYKASPDYLHGFWHLARAIAFNVPKKEEVKTLLVNSIAGYQQAVPDCIVPRVDALIQRSTSSVHPPAGWTLTTGDQVAAVREELNVQRIFDDLKAGGETAELMYLAACGSEVPEMYVKVLETAENADNLVTLRVAAGEEAAASNTINVEVKVIGPPEAATLKGKKDAVVRITGKISGFQGDPFLLKLVEGQVNAEDLKDLE